MLILIFCLTAGTSAPDGQVVYVALNHSARAVNTVISHNQENSEAIGPAEAWRRLTGLEDDIRLNTATLQRILNRAERFRMTWRDNEANGFLEQVITQVTSVSTPTLEQRKIGILAAHTMVEALSLTEKNPEKAVKKARAAWFAFGDVAVDTRRFSQKVTKLIKKGRPQGRSKDAIELTVTSTQNGQLFAAARYLGPIQGEKAVWLEPGVYRIWIENSSGRSLPHRIELKKQPAKLHIDTALETRLSFDKLPVLNCRNDCDHLLQRLSNELGGIRVIPLDGSESRNAAIAAVSPSAPDFGTTQTVNEMTQSDGHGFLLGGISAGISAALLVSGAIVLGAAPMEDGVLAAPDPLSRVEQHNIMVITGWSLMGMGAAVGALATYFFVSGQSSESPVVAVSLVSGGAFVVALGNLP